MGESCLSLGEWGRAVYLQLIKENVTRVAENGQGNTSEVLDPKEIFFCRSRGSLTVLSSTGSVM